VQVRIREAISWSDTAKMLERREIHIGQNLLNAVRSDDPQLVRRPLEAMELMAAGNPSLMHGVAASIDLASLASYPLLLLDAGFVSRRTFDATCRTAGIEVRSVFESRTPHTLLAMAEAGHGVAVVPPCELIDTGCELPVCPTRGSRCASLWRASVSRHVTCRPISGIDPKKLPNRTVRFRSGAMSQSDPPRRRAALQRDGRYLVHHVDLDLVVVRTVEIGGTVGVVNTAQACP
jgi:hypothetical protein